MNDEIWSHSEWNSWSSCINCTRFRYRECSHEHCERGRIFAQTDFLVRNHSQHSKEEPAICPCKGLLGFEYSGIWTEWTSWSTCRIDMGNRKYEKMDSVEQIESSRDVTCRRFRECKKDGYSCRPDEFEQVASCENRVCMGFLLEREIFERFRHSGIF